MKPQVEMIEALVLCEARADFETATHLARRVLEEGALTVAFESVLRWRGVEPGTSYTPLSKLKKAVKATGLKLPRYLGHVKGQPKKSDAAIALRGVQIARLSLISVLLFVRDLDSSPQRLQGIEQAREEAGDTEIEMILATPDPEREAWVLNGFVARSAAEENAFAKEMKQLGFDPCVESHRLRGDVRRGQEKRDIKKLVERLTGGDRDREKACGEVTPLALLEERGRTSRLADYLVEIKSRLLPLLLTS